MVAEEQDSGRRYAGNSELVAAFLFMHRELTETIHRLCRAKGPEALKNHASDALECLISTQSESPAPLEHLLGLRIQTYLDLFGPMTFVKAVAAEYELEGVVEEYMANRPAPHAVSRGDTQRLSHAASPRRDASS
jgi:hypothetical protein